MNDEQKEKYLQDKLAEFCEQMKEAAEKVIGDVHCDYLPHVMSDTECNVSFQTQDALKSILERRFTVRDDRFVSVNGMLIFMPSYDRIASSIYNAAKDKIENAAIEELKKEIEYLECRLQEAYRRY